MIRFKCFIIAILCFFSFFLSAQKEYNTIRTNEKITIDGNLNESVWVKVQVADSFIAFQPSNGIIPKSKCTARLVYDDKAIYIGAFLSESSRDSISTELVQRDDIGNTDWFGILLDIYGNGSDGLEFIVQTTGVQFDARLTNNGDDQSWNAVWESATVLTDEGWFVEMKIPYSALRFPEEEIQNWRINFINYHARTGEKSLWNPINPEESGFMRQFGYLKGLKGIKSPIRLSLSPYFSTYYNHTRDVEEGNTNTYAYNGGMDLKYGINDAFTLDMTLIPDFGQTRSDDLELNLGPFETRYNENRDFFTEGVDLFEKGNLFYSRRVGNQPIGYWDVEDQLNEGEMIEINPGKSKLYNATKISGRTTKGLGIGFFNAVAGETNAIIKNKLTGKKRSFKTSPLTNFNVFVLDQNLKNNSSISLINTNVWRRGEDHHDANVTGTEFSLNTKNQKFNFSGNGAVSQLYNKNTDNEYGYKFSLDIDKISGKFNYGIGYSEESDTYNPNDLGFVYSNNERAYYASTNYQVYKQIGFISRGNFWLNFNHERLNNTNAFVSNNVNAGLWVQTVKQWSYNLWMNYSPTSYDYYEPRIEGRYLASPAYSNLGIWLGTDDRKKFRVSTNLNYTEVDENGRFNYSLSFSPRFRFSDKFTINTNSSYRYSSNSKNYVTDEDDGMNIYFGNRDRTTIVNSASFFYNINNKMGIDLRIRHYWSKVAHDQFYILNQDGNLSNSDHEGNYDFSYNAFNIDLNYKWRFAPGSDIIFAWRNNISGSNENEDIDFMKLSYGKSIEHLEELPSNNSVSLKLIYYIDYNRFVKS